MHLVYPVNYILNRREFVTWESTFQKLEKTNKKLLGFKTLSENNDLTLLFFISRSPCTCTKYLNICFLIGMYKWSSIIKMDWLIVQLRFKSVNSIGFSSDCCSPISPAQSFVSRNKQCNRLLSTSLSWPVTDKYYSSITPNYQLSIGWYR